MAGRGNPSFLKNQKARKRQEKAAAKRAARQARRDEKANRGLPGAEEPMEDGLEAGAAEPMDDGAENAGDGETERDEAPADADGAAR